MTQSQILDAFQNAVITDANERLASVRKGQDITQTINDFCVTFLCLTHKPHSAAAMQTLRDIDFCTVLVEKGVGDIFTLKTFLENALPHFTFTISDEEFVNAIIANIKHNAVNDKPRISEKKHHNNVLHKLIHSLKKFF